jgi:hypothetical protein
MSAKYDFDLFQGATFTRTLTLKDANDAPIDLSIGSQTFSGQIRTSYTSNDVAATFSVTAMGGSDGTVSWTLSATDSAAVPAQQCVYDIEYTQANGDVVRILEGFVNVKPNVTR